MNAEVIFLGHDNSIDIVLKENNTAVDLSGVTRMTLSFGTVAVDSTNSTAHVMTWAKGGYATGEVRIKLGGSTRVRDLVGSGSHYGTLILYDTTFTEGVVWGEIPFLIKSDMEGTT